MLKEFLGSDILENVLRKENLTSEQLKRRLIA